MCPLWRGRCPVAADGAGTRQQPAQNRQVRRVFQVSRQFVVGSGGRGARSRPRAVGQRRRAWAASLEARAGGAPLGSFFRPLIESGLDQSAGFGLVSASRKPSTSPCVRPSSRSTDDMRFSIADMRASSMPIRSPRSLRRLACPATINHAKAAPTLRMPISKPRQAENQFRCHGRASIASLRQSTPGQWESRSVPRWAEETTGIREPGVVPSAQRHHEFVPLAGGLYDEHLE